MRQMLRLLFVICAGLSVSAALAQNTLVLPGQSPYAASPYPDRIVLTPSATPQSIQLISWRTDTSVTSALAQISIAGDSPHLGAQARQLSGVTQYLQAENGDAHFHQLRVDGLMPDTLYAYRVAGYGTWSEWFQFRTASDQGFEPFQALYFGDAQNSVKSLYSRVVRQGVLLAPQARLFIHAGDLIDRDGRLDDHWGEWFDAGSWMSASINQMVVPGNHEYDETAAPVQLAAHWAPQFAVAGNGPDVLRNTVYYSLYQGVLFVSLDSTQAVHDAAMAELQAQWLDQVLSRYQQHWTVVSYHHPMFSVSHGIESPNLAQHWRPVFERHGVDLVLQGHDHVYGRGQNLMSGASGQLAPDGPVYLVSVAGPKMNLVSLAAEQSLDLTAEDVQLFQIISFETDRIYYESRTATGRLHDAFELVRDAAGQRRVVDIIDMDGSRVNCSNPDSQPAMVDSSGRARPGRCWDGFSWP